jgi:iron complex transport system substrate-binding protein
MKVVSLLPSATEIVCALGLEDILVGRSHECDYPASVKELPVVTRPSFTAQKQSKEIDISIENLLKNGLSPFEADTALLRELNPDVILTQDHCEVCAISTDQLAHAAGDYLQNSDVTILSLSPSSLKEILQSVVTVGDQLHVPEQAKALCNEVRERLDIIRQTVLGEPEKSVVSIEWLSPLMTAGNWIPELISLAGGVDLMGTPGIHSPWIEPDKLLAANPDIILIMPCGYDIPSILSEYDALKNMAGWDSLKAVQNGDVYFLDGNQYFNRPGPRIYDSVRITAEILHPGLFQLLYRESGWISMQDAIKEIA